jgi:Bacterial dnaA protein helix-turn-helix
MAELTEHTFFPFSSHLFRTEPEPAADELIDALKRVLQRAAAGNGVSQLTGLARRALAELRHIQGADGLAAISEFVGREFHLRADDLRSKARDQRTAFCRQLAMHLCRRITGKPFAVIGTHFNRDYSTVIHACHLTEQRTQRDAAFRLFVEKLEGRITRTIPATAQGRGASWRSREHTQITVIAASAASRCGSTAIFCMHACGAPPRCSIGAVF